VLKSLGNRDSRKTETEIFRKTDTENRPILKNNREETRKPTPTRKTDTDPALPCISCYGISRHIVETSQDRKQLRHAITAGNRFSCVHEVPIRLERQPLFRQPLFRQLEMPAELDFYFI
jgi:hypothetical protein